MPIVVLITPIHAPVERVFDLARSIDLHLLSTSQTQERAVAGVTSGLIGLGEQVTWEAKHFGFWQRLTVEITGYNRPWHFSDRMIEGRFAHLHHDHWFTADGDITRMTDVFDFRSPFGPLGRLADALFLAGYMKRLLAKRNACIRQAAESEQWKQVLTAS